MALRDKRRALLVRDTLRAMKEGIGACKVCDRPYEPDYPGSFHFDHTYPETKTHAYRGSLFGHGMRYGVMAMVREIVLKCEMLCAKCHRWKTRFDNRQAPILWL